MADKQYVAEATFNKFIKSDFVPLKNRCAALKRSEADTIDYISELEDRINVLRVVSIGAFCSAVVALIIVLVTVI